MTRPAIEFKDVWKAYPRWGSGGRTVRGIVSQRMPLLARKGEMRWALRDVSVQVPAGGSVGLIGGNGAGKSTMLRLASGLGRATRGHISIPERSASVLTLGDAFDFSLTGRENALTAAIVAGMSRAQARSRIPAILEFAELESFADAPMRTYSDGMRLRLAFGVLAQLEPQALLLDEVIAVGDMRFQAKCMERIRELRANGTTVLFASHDLHSVASECDQALWLQAGTVRSFGDAATVVGEYRDAMRSDTLAQTPPPDASAPSDGDLELRRNRFGNQAVTIEDVVFRGADAVPTTETVSGAPLALTLTLRRKDATVADPIVGVAIHRVEDGLVCWDGNTEADGMRIAEVDAPVEIELNFTRLDLLPGEYLVDVGVYDRDWNGAYDFHWQAYPLTVVGHRGDKGVFRPPHGWRVAEAARDAGRPR